MERCDAIPTFFKKPGAKLALAVRMDDGHGCGTWDERTVYRDLLSENVALQWECPRGVGAKYRFLGREHIQERCRVVIRPGERHINFMLSILGMVGCKLVVTQGGARGHRAAEGLGGPLGFFGWQPKVTLAMDSSAARGAAPRVGAGLLRRMELKTLWLQNAVEDGRIRLQGVPGGRDVAGIGTKALVADRQRLLAGRASSRRPAKRLCTWFESLRRCCDQSAEMARPGKGRWKILAPLHACG